MKYECDCGRVFTDPDGPIMCSDSGHGQGNQSINKRIEELKAEIEYLNNRLESGRDYLMMKQGSLTVDEVFVAFGWDENGF